LAALTLIEFTARSVTRYNLTLEPWSAFLARGRDSRIFQDMAVFDILDAIFSRYQGQGKLAPIWRFDILDRALYPKRSITTQYRESDLAFAEHLMREEGLFHYFEHSGDAASPSLGNHTMVIADHNGSFKPNAQAGIDFTQPGAVMKRDSMDRWRLELRASKPMRSKSAAGTTARSVIAPAKRGQSRHPGMTFRTGGWRWPSRPAAQTCSIRGWTSCLPRARHFRWLAFSMCPVAAGTDPDMAFFGGWTAHFLALLKLCLNTRRGFFRLGVGLGMGHQCGQQGHVAVRFRRFWLGAPLRLGLNRRFFQFRLGRQLSATPWRIDRLDSSKQGRFQRLAQYVAACLRRRFGVGAWHAFRARRHLVIDGRRRRRGQHFCCRDVSQVDSLAVGDRCRARDINLRLIPGMALRVPSAATGEHGQHAGCETTPHQQPATGPR
jgi:hypothetical protein